MAVWKIKGFRGLGEWVEERTDSVWGVLAHLSDQLGHSIPVLVAAGIVELLDVVCGFDCVGLGVRTAMLARLEIIEPGFKKETREDIPCCLVGKPTRTTMA